MLSNCGKSKFRNDIVDATRMSANVATGDWRVGIQAQQKTLGLKRTLKRVDCEYIHTVYSFVKAVMRSNVGEMVQSRIFCCEVRILCIERGNN